MTPCREQQHSPDGPRSKKLSVLGSYLRRANETRSRRHLQGEPGPVLVHIGEILTEIIQRIQAYRRLLTITRTTKRRTTMGTTMNHAEPKQAPNDNVTDREEWLLLKRLYRWRDITLKDIQDKI